MRLGLEQESIRRDDVLICSPRPDEVISGGQISVRVMKSANGAGSGGRIRR